MATNKLIDQYCKDNDLSEDENRAIVWFFKHCFTKMSKELVDVRWKYFGSFQVMRTPLLRHLKHLKSKKHTTEIDLEKIKMIEDYVENHPQLFDTND